MRINISNTKLDEESKPYLVKERAVNYNYENIKAANSPEIIVKLMNRLFDLENRSEEYMYAISMNAAHKPLAIFEVSHGAIDHTVASTRDILIKTLLSGGLKIVLVHNHPSGDMKPSSGDCRFTRKLMLASELLDLRLIDHIIIGKNSFLSFKEYGLFDIMGGKNL